MSTAPRKARNDARQGRLPYGAAEAHRRENIDLLRKLAKDLGLPVKARELLIRITIIEHDNGEPLRKTYHQLGCPERGMGCSIRTAIYIVKRLQQEGLITVHQVKTGAGQRPNEYRINWDGVRLAFAKARESQTRCHDDDPACNYCRSSVQKLQSQGAILADPACKNCTHSKYSPLIPPLNTSPNRTEPAPGEDPVRFGSVSEKVFLDHQHWPSVRDEANVICQALGKPKEGMERDDLLLAVRVASLKRLGVLPEEIFAETLRMIKSGRIKGEPIRSRAAAFRSGLAVRCKKAGFDFHGLIDSLELPEWAEDEIAAVTKQSTKQEVCA